MRYRKRSAEIEAVRFDGSWESAEWFVRNYCSNVIAAVSHESVYLGYLIVRTFEADWMVRPGDYIITEVDGKRYPCTPDVFDATYELVEGQV